MSGPKPFPEVVPANITAIAGQLGHARDDLSTAKAQVAKAAAGATWKSPQARPAWDAAVVARGSDLAGAYDVLDHASNVLTTLGKHLADLKQEYDAAVGALGTDPNTGDFPPKPGQLQAYNTRVTNCNDAADSATLAIILAAQQLHSLCDGVTFPQPPQVCMDWSSYVDPKNLTVMPFAPAFGAPQGAIFANGIPIQFLKGRAFESKILEQLGISNEIKQLWRPDPNDPWTFPRIQDGQFKGTYPDSRQAGILEVKSGTKTSICATNDQIRLQRALAAITGQSWSLIADTNTPVDQELLEAADASGGGVFSKVPGMDGKGGPFYNRYTGEYVNLKSVDGKLEQSPLTPDEVEKIDEGVRKSVEDGAKTPPDCKGSNTQPPTPQGVPAWAPEPAQQPVTNSEYQFAWDHAKDGKYQGSGGNVPQVPSGGVPVVPLPGGMPMPEMPEMPVFPEFPIPIFG